MSDRGAILVVDDEPTIAEVVRRYLERAGYRVHTAGDGHAALAAPAVDLVVLDLMLPGVDGLGVLQRLRERDPAPAVILLTARGEESDRIVGLRLGADDYVVKPFSPGELVARVEAVLRRAQPTRDPGPPVVLGPLRIDVAAHQATCGDVPLTLTQREFDLLLHLARHPGRAFSREELMEQVWRHAFYTDTSTVTVHVRRVRTKLAVHPRGAELIETVWGIGYRMTEAPSCA